MATDESEVEPTPTPELERATTAQVRRQARENFRVHTSRLRRRLHLTKLWLAVLRSLLVSVLLLGILLLLTFLVAVAFYLVNRDGNIDSSRYRQLKALQAEFNDSLYEVARLSRTARVFDDPELTRKLLRLRQLGRNYEYKNVEYAIKQHEMKPSLGLSMYYAVTLVSLIGYGDVAGASELQYFSASLCMLIVVPVWYIYHHQLYHLFYFLQLYCHRRWFEPESRSNHTMMVLWAIRIRNANVYRRSRFYLSNLAIMIAIFPLSLAAFAITDSHLSISDQLWLTVQSIFHIGLGDIPEKSTAYWLLTFFMISTCFLIYFQCFSFIMPQYPALRMSRIVQNDFSSLG